MHLLGHARDMFSAVAGRIGVLALVVGMAIAAGQGANAGSLRQQPEDPTGEPPEIWFERPVEVQVDLPPQAEAQLRIASVDLLPADCAELAPPGGDPPEACAYGYVVLNGVPQAGVPVTLSTAVGLTTVVTALGPSSGQPYYVAALDWPPLSATAGEIVSAQADLSGEPNTTYFLAAPGVRQVDIWYSSTCGPTYVSGLILADTTWQRECGPYVVTDNLMVYQGITLTILPGTEVVFYADKSLRVDGELLALGDDLALLHFTANGVSTPGAWGHILFSPTSVDATFDPVTGNYTGGTILVYALVDFAGGTTATDKSAVRVDASAPFLTHTHIRKSGGDGVRAYNGGVIYFTGGAVTDSAGWGFYNNGTTAKLTVATSEIARNGKGGLYSVGDTTAWVLANRILANPINYAVQVVNGFANVGLNWVEDNAGGVYFNDGANIAQNVIMGSTTNGGIRRYGGTTIINYNVIYDNANPTTYGGGIGFQSSSSNSVDVHDNVIASNHAKFGGGVAFVYGPANLQKNAILNNTSIEQGGALYHGTSSTLDINIEDNTILNNQAGSGKGGMYIAKFPTIQDNNIYGNTPFDLFNGNLVSTAGLKAEYNWWGTVDGLLIFQHIWDYADDSTLSLVDFDPWYVGPLTVDAPISPPTGFVAGAGATGIDLIWAANPESDTAGYLVYYDTDEAGYPYRGKGALQGDSPIDVDNVLAYSLTGLPNNIYHVTVTAYDHAADGEYDQPDGHESWFANEQIVVVGEPPGAFGKSLPASGATGQPLSLALVWGPSYTAERYEYCYDTSNDNLCSSWVNTGLTTGANLTGLALGTTYFWSVRAVNASGTTYADGGIYWSFTTGNVPGTFNKSSPSNNASNRPLATSLSWAASSGVVSYEYCYDTSDDDACSAWADNGTAISVPLAGLLPATSYYWQVQAHNTFGTTYANGSATAFWKFTTGATPQAFSKSAPADGATGQPLDLAISWAVSTGATGYQYCYDTSNDGDCSTWTSSGTATNANLSGLAPGTTYYWQVRASNTIGTTYANAGAFWSFTTLGLEKVYLPLVSRP